MVTVVLHSSAPCCWAGLGVVCFLIVVLRLDWFRIVDVNLVCVLKLIVLIVIIWT